MKTFKLKRKGTDKYLCYIKSNGKWELSELKNSKFRKFNFTDQDFIGNEDIIKTLFDFK